MTKAILVIDKPESCVFCPLLDGELGECKAGGVIEDNENPTKCLLKPIPTKYTSFVEAEDDSDEAIFEEIAVNGERRGWNNCIDELLSEEVQNRE